MKIKPTIEYGYLMGLLLTDGWFTDLWDRHTIKGKLYEYRRRQVGFGQDDKELIVEAKKAIERLFSRHPKIKFNKKQKRYSLALQHKQTVGFLYDATKGKTEIPEKILKANKEVKRAFIAGAMDGDGWISRSKDRRKKTHIGQKQERQLGIKGGYGYQFMMGFSGHGEYFEQTLEMMKELGVVLRSRQLKDNGKSVTDVVNINIKSFIDSGCYFKCLRKQLRLSEYKKQILKISSETTKSAS
jgi:hypothetical protein